MQRTAPGSVVLAPGRPRMIAAGTLGWGAEGRRGDSRGARQSKRQA